MSFANEISILTKDVCDLVFDGRVKSLVAVDIQLLGQSEWELLYEIVVKHETTGNFYKGVFSSGAMRTTDPRPLKYDEILVFKRVKPVTGATTLYLPIDNPE